MSGLPLSAIRAEKRRIIAFLMRMFEKAMWESGYGSGLRLWVHRNKNGSFRRFKIPGYAIHEVMGFTADSALIEDAQGHALITHDLRGLPVEDLMALEVWARKYKKIEPTNERGKV